MNLNKLKNNLVAKHSFNAIKNVLFLLSIMLSVTVIGFFVFDDFLNIDKAAREFMAFWYVCPVFIALFRLPFIKVDIDELFFTAVLPLLMGLCMWCVCYFVYLIGFLELGSISKIAGISIIPVAFLVHCIVLSKKSYLND